MNLPWVSRRAFDQSVAVAETLRRACEQWETHASRVAENAQADLERAEKRYADLMTKFTMLRLQGAHEPAPAAVAYAPKEIDPCVAAINAKFSGNRASLRAGAMRQLAADRAKGIPDESILQLIETGVTDLADIPV